MVAASSLSLSWLFSRVPQSPSSRVRCRVEKNKNKTQVTERRRVVCARVKPQAMRMKHLSHSPYGVRVKRAMMYKKDLKKKKTKQKRKEEESSSWFVIFFLFYFLSADYVWFFIHSAFFLLFLLTWMIHTFWSCRQGDDFPSLKII